MQSLDELFGPRGPLARSLPGFTPRRSQLAMASRVALAMENRAPLVVEAGTGTGKTFAYLVPALLSGKRVLISTGTRTLQDQLFNKDLPLVAGAIGVPARVALLKGRSNYLCSYRLRQLGGQSSLVGHARPHAGARGALGAASRSSGDLAEVPDLGDAHPLWPQITSTRENCLGARCADIGRCHVVEARRKAIESDIVIVNHHLLLADLALKEDGFGDLLGAADAVIIDEAHQIPDLATQFFGTRFGSRQVELLLRDARQELTQCARTATALAAELGAVEKALAALAEILRGTPRPDWLAADTPLRGCRAGTVAFVARRSRPRSTSRAARPAIAQCAARATRARRAARRSRARGGERRRAQRRAHAARFLAEPAAIRRRRAIRGDGARHARGLGVHFGHAFGGRGLRAFHLAARTRRGRNARHRRARSISRRRRCSIYPRMPDPASPAHFLIRKFGAE